VVLGLLDAKELVRYSLDVPCNDGTQAVYYFRAGEGSGAKRWVIRLQGGGWCWDIGSCQGRQQSSPYWTSSKYCPTAVNDTQDISGVPHGGILSSDPTINPDFYNANQVYLWYCSSDSHSGNRTASPETNNWHFRGKDIVAAMIGHLINQQNPSITGASEILLTGDSAGGVATLSNVEYIRELLGSIVDTAVYRAYVDAGWFLDVAPYQGGFSFQMCAKSLYQNLHVVYDKACMAAYKGQEWHCFHAQYVVPYIKTPLLFHEFLIDSANLGFDGVPGAPNGWNQTTLNWVQNFRSAMLTLTENVSIFAPNCFRHEVEDSNMLGAFHINNKVFTQVLGEWFLSQNPTLVRYVDSCSPINCSQDCK